MLDRRARMNEIQLSSTRFGAVAELSRFPFELDGEAEFALRA